jgi:hypothetical protein
MPSSNPGMHVHSLGHGHEQTLVHALVGFYSNGEPLNSSLGCTATESKLLQCKSDDA